MFPRLACVFIQFYVSNFYEVEVVVCLSLNLARHRDTASIVYKMYNSTLATQSG